MPGFEVHDGCNMVNVLLYNIKEQQQNVFFDKLGSTNLVSNETLRRKGFTERFATWRSGGFLVLKHNRRTAHKPTSKMSC